VTIIRNKKANVMSRDVNTAHVTQSQQKLVIGDTQSFETSHN